MPDTSRTPHMAHEIQVPPEVRALSTLSRIDYQNAVLVETDTRPDSALQRTAEQWARAALEDAPAEIRRTLTQQWTARFGLQLEPAHPDRHVLGWPIRRSAPDHALLGTASDNGLQAELLIQCRPDALLFASFIQHDTDDARARWAEAEHLHAPAMCRLLDDAIGRATPA
ncbi:hypothetical protein [Agromyces laixinhei]|uniref:hypothetical protein n=1 Tax=Agromyces laixinhei TaxID=2585717 RepID=UPI0012ECE796|nr:hypothetical protein [Agromyces laixinhei]